MKNFIITEAFPVLIQPKDRKISLTNLIALLPTYKTKIQDFLLKYGAIRLRGFPIHTAFDFEKIIETINLGNFTNYIGGDSPRKKVINKVYTSTEAPHDFQIPLHQELSYAHNIPKHIYFFCEIAPTQGGETTIADARKIFQNLNSNLKNKFDKKKLNYISHYPFKKKFLNFINPSHRSWRDVFETNQKHEVEQICLNNEISWRWLRNDWIEIRGQGLQLGNIPSPMK